MVDEKILRFHVVAKRGTDLLEYPVHRIVCAGYSGRSQKAAQEHVNELLALGLPAPESTPIFFKVSTYLATTGTGITVQDRLTSGEAEFVLLFHQGETYVTCGSDHTHRELERHSIPGAKQMHPQDSSARGVALFGRRGSLGRVDASLLGDRGRRSRVMPGSSTFRCPPA
jgi:Protein of unknown function (DUF2848)